jgi:hypothetical protein
VTLRAQELCEGVVPGLLPSDGKLGPSAVTHRSALPRRCNVARGAIVKGARLLKIRRLPFGTALPQEES